jgi:putative heme-binding domain-containing protein
MLDRLQRDAESIVANEEKSPAERAQAVGWLAWYRKRLPLELLWEQLDPAQPAEVQIAVIRLLLSQDDRDGETYAKEILARWKKLSPQVRDRAGDAFLADRYHKQLMLAAVKNGAIAGGDLTPKQLSELSGKSEIVRAVSNELRAKVVADYAESLKLAGDKARGEELFKKHCSACHKLNGVGHEIGPNLAAMKTRGSEAILTNVLDPNREVNPQFVTYAVVTKEGRVLTGMISAETANSLTLKQAENKEETVLRIDIEELKSTGLSLMPEGLEKNLDKQQLADVIEYLMKQ